MRELYAMPHAFRIAYKIEKEKHYAAMPTGKFLVALLLNYINDSEITVLPNVLNMDTLLINCYDNI